MFQVVWKACWSTLRCYKRRFSRDILHHFFNTSNLEDCLCWKSRVLFWDCLYKKPIGHGCIVVVLGTYWQFVSATSHGRSDAMSTSDECECWKLLATWIDFQTLYFVSEINLTALASLSAAMFSNCWFEFEFLSFYFYKPTAWLTVLSLGLKMIWPLWVLCHRIMYLFNCLLFTISGTEAEHSRRKEKPWD